jgi:uncharacterized Fe-S cluster-containing radical SAM superfamily protein
VKGLIKVGYGCNENCTFCHTADLRHIEDDKERVDHKIERARALGYTMVVLSGGEPTARPELLSWARRVAALGLDFGLVTNGLLLSYPDVTRELIERGRLRYVYMSLHGGDAKVHRSVVRADTFDRAIAAIELLAYRVPDFTINCVITTANVDHLRGLVERLARLDAALRAQAADRADAASAFVIKLSMTQPKGGGDHAFDVIVPDVARVAAAVKDAIDHGRAIDSRLRFAHDGVPLCLLPGLEALYDDLKTHRFAAMIEADEDDFVPVDDVAKVHPPPCDDCSLKGPCPGLYAGYERARGHAMLRPVEGARANSFNVIPERDIARPKGAPCPIARDGVTPYDRARTLFLRFSDRMRLARTDTRDFSDVELGRIKERGQLYVDVSKKLAPDDFATDLRKLLPDPDCASCSSRAACTGAFVMTKGDVFTRDDARVLAIVRELRGRVLDLGCGEGRYLSAFAPSLVDYTGVDPDGDALATLASRFSWARFVVANAEDYAPEGALDHVLALRSWNHFKRPEKALEQAVFALREGGTLTVVDDEPFGLVREATHARRAEGSTKIAEHRRLDDAARAHARLSALPLELLERRDVSPSTSCQWLLRYRRIAAR